MKTLLLFLTLCLPAPAQSLFQALLALPQSSAPYAFNATDLISDWNPVSYTTNAGMATLPDAWGIHHLTNSTGSSVPLRTNGMVNGYPALYFDGLDDFLRAEQYTAGGSFTHEVWLVVSPRPSGIVSHRFFDSVSATATNRHLGLLAPNGGSGGDRFTNLMSAGVVIHSATGLPTNSWTGWKVLTYVFDGANSRALTNGLVDFSGNAGSNVISGLTMGARLNLVENGRFWLARALAFSKTNSGPNVLAISNALSIYQ